MLEQYAGIEKATVTLTPATANGQTLAVGKPALGVARACREGIGVESPFADFREYLELVLTVLEPLGLGLVLMLACSGALMLELAHG